MKKKLLSFGLITTLSISATLGWSSSPSLLPSKSCAEMSHTTQNIHSFSPLLAMGTHENLKAYHIGLKSIFPNHHIPSTRDLLNSIRSHTQFVGILNQEEALARFQAGESSYFIFEERSRPRHFYIAHSGGMRHFTINGEEIAGMDNGEGNQYPSLNHFLQCTLTV